MLQQLQLKRNTGAAFIYFIVIVATFLLFGTLIWVTRQYTQPGAVTANRAAERLQNLDTLRATEGPILSEYAWQDMTKGLVRIPIERAMALTVEEWQKDPVAGRSQLIARMQEATAPPPAVEEAPSEFE